MRTLDPVLEGALDSQNFTPYIYVRLGSRINFSLPYKTQVVKYRLGAVEASVSFVPPVTLVEAITRFQLVRGVLIEGVPYTIESAYFWVTNAVFDARFYHLEGHILQPSYRREIPPDETYSQVIDRFFRVIDPQHGDLGNVHLEDPAADWLDYTFLPDGRAINDSRYILPLLRQKYLIFARENFGYIGPPSIQYHVNDLSLFVASEEIDEQYTLEDPLFKFNTGLTPRQFLWKDETDTVHTEGDPLDGIHNLGYLESSASPPPLIDAPRAGSKALLPIHLKYQTGDYITINPGYPQLHTYTGRIEVTEVLDTNKEPSWYCEIEPLAFFGSTEGGTLPYATEQAAAFIPIVASSFSRVLDRSASNLQSLAERVDVHTHEGSGPQSLSAFRNILINGDMQVSQRGTSEGGLSALSAGSYRKAPDRWKLWIKNLGTWSVFQSALGTFGVESTGCGYAYSLQCTTAAPSPVADSYLSLSQAIEGQFLQRIKKGTAQAQPLTLSFIVRSSVTGTYIVELYEMDNLRQVSASYTINAIDTWEYKTVTFPPDTIGEFDKDSAGSLQVTFWLASGSNYTTGPLQTSWGSIVGANRAEGQVNFASTVGNTFYLTGIQLETGSEATEFEHLPFDVQLLRCLRYYQKSYRYDKYAGDGYNRDMCTALAISTVYARPLNSLRVAMRAVPTTILYSTNGTVNKITTADTVVTAGAGVVTMSSPGEDRPINILDNGGGLTTGKLYFYHFTADAEL